MTSVALHDDHPAHRHLRMLGADLVFRAPFLGQLSRKHGTTLACNADAERLLAADELVGVLPEGFKGIGKPFADRYKLQRFGRGGFVSAALRTGLPIIPCSIVGAEETYPKIGDIQPLARLLSLPYFPVTPTFPLLGPLGAIPLPSKWLIEFGEPIPTDELGPDAADDPMVVFNLTDQVRETIQHTLYRLLAAAARQRLPRAEQPSRLAAVGQAARPTSAARTGTRRPRTHRRRRDPGRRVRPVRKSRICQPRSRATSRRSRSGLTATAVPTTESIGTSFTESE